jgi:hypothetical protein
VEVRHHADVDAFLAVAGDFLGAREAEHNLIFGIASSLAEAPEQYTGAPYLATVADGDAVIAAAIQTPPFRLVLSEIDDAAAISALAADTLDRALPGVLGPVGIVERFVAARTAAGGPAGVLAMSERVFRLTTVQPPQPVAGTARLASPADRDLVHSWLDAFLREALGEADPADVASMTDRWIAGRSRTLHLWEDGDPVSMCGIGGRTPNGIRIGPVYTPPDRRGRGYASALVAAVSQAALDSGLRFCFLFTDAANPTANHIYQAIGYEHVRDVLVYDFATP